VFTDIRNVLSLVKLEAASILRVRATRKKSPECTFLCSTLGNERQSRNKKGEMLHTIAIARVPGSERLHIQKRISGDSALPKSMLMLRPCPDCNNSKVFGLAP
jgi:hypothetical protein